MCVCPRPSSTMFYLLKSLFLLFLFAFATLFPPSPTSYEHQFYDVMSCFTRFIMNAKYVCHGPISPHANLLVNRLVGTVILLVKRCRWGRVKEKEPFLPFQLLYSGFFRKMSPENCEKCAKLCK